MSTVDSPVVGRRQFLVNGGLVLSLGAIVAACGDRAGSVDPGRLGVASPAPTLPVGSVSDVVLLRTLQSLEHSAILVYSKIAAIGGFTSVEAALATRITSDHAAHSESIGLSIDELDGARFECSNAFVVDRVIDPVFAAIAADSDDAHRDLLNVAHAFETLLGASYQAIVGSLQNPALRASTMHVGCEEHRHAASLALAINPDARFSPVFFGLPVEKDADGFLMAFAVPSTFGRVGGIDLVVGAPDVNGARFGIQLQTPAENSFVYEYETC